MRALLLSCALFSALSVGCSAPPPASDASRDAAVDAPAGCRLLGGVCPYGTRCFLDLCNSCFCTLDGQLQCDDGGIQACMLDAAMDAPADAAPEQ